MEKPIFKNKEKALEAGKCFDCEKNIEVTSEEVKNGALLVYENGNEDVFTLKCDDCLKRSEGIEGYQKCEVYSRIVGYLRPVTQWNAGKRREYEERKEYKVSEA